MNVCRMYETTTTVRFGESKFLPRNSAKRTLSSLEISQSWVGRITIN
jgi:hypothetical protein